MQKSQRAKRHVFLKYLIGFLVGVAILPIPLGLIAETVYPAHGAGLIFGIVIGLIAGGPLGVSIVFVFARLVCYHTKRNQTLVE